MKIKLLFLSFALLSLYACEKSDITRDPTPPTPPPTSPENVIWSVAENHDISRKGGVYNIAIGCNYPYKASVETSGFITLMSTKVMTTGTLAISFAQNTTGKVRSQDIKLSGNSGPSGYFEKLIKVTQEPMGSNVVFADITSAKSLYVAQSTASAASKSAGASQKLYKIAATGVVEDVVFKDENGDTTAVAIDFIRNMSDKYVYMSLNMESGEKKQYVVRKSDGAVFAAKLPYIGKNTTIQTDYRQNVYYVSGSSLYKMYDYNNGVDIAKITQDYMEPSKFLVDQKGNVLFDYRNTISGSYDNLLCYTSSGEFARSKWGSWVNDGYFTFILKMDSENFYSIVPNANSYGRLASIVKIRVALPELTSEVLFDDLEMSGKKITFDYSVLLRFILDDMTVFVSSSTVTPAILSMVNDKSYKLLPLSRALPQYSKELKPIKGYIYGYNNDEIFRINISTGVIETVYTNVEYSIYDFNVTDEEVLTFSALELRKAQDVLCEIRNGQLKVLKTDGSQKVIQLERIN